MFLTLPKNSKPSKSTSGDSYRPVLQCAELREHDGRWELVVTDSFRLAHVRLEVHESPDGPQQISAGPISPEALKALEKTGAFYADEYVSPCDQSGQQTGQKFDRPYGQGDFPQWDNLMPDQQDGPCIGLDAEFLYKLAESLGAKLRKDGATTNRVILRFQADSDRRINPLRPMIVTTPTTPDTVGLLMPVRTDV